MDAIRKNLDFSNQVRYLLKNAVVDVNGTIGVDDRIAEEVK